MVTSMRVGKNYNVSRRMLNVDYDRVFMKRCN